VIVFALMMSMGFFASTACAEIYVSGNLGAAFINDADFEEPEGYTGKMSFDTGFGLTGAVGTTFENGTRVEVEVGYYDNDINELKFDGFGTRKVDGDIQVISAMANGYLNFSENWMFSPFVGAGLGAANIKVDPYLINNEEDDVFAYQVMLGAAAPLDETLTVDFQYRFFGVNDPDFKDYEFEYSSHNLMVGIRKSF
ncbi:MAG: outer membrane beta-barrel protein, partial [Desulfuromonadales bacterium]|nr:outer membrane beta-barrel protein [Desulfuromonadales bacterium]